MNTPTIPQVPDKLSDLIQLALDDIDKCQKDERYVINMGTWHSLWDGKCHVCLAGAVMAQTHELPLNKSPLNLWEDNKWKHAFHALDDVRMGKLGNAYLLFTGRLLPDDVPRSSPHPAKEWRLNAEWCRDELRRFGL